MIEEDKTSLEQIEIKQLATMQNKLLEFATFLDTGKIGISTIAQGVIEGRKVKVSKYSTGYTIEISGESGALSFAFSNNSLRAYFTLDENTQLIAELPDNQKKGLFPEPAVLQKMEELTAMLDRRLRSLKQVPPKMIAETHQSAIGLVDQALNAPESTELPTEWKITSVDDLARRYFYSQSRGLRVNQHISYEDFPSVIDQNGKAHKSYQHKPRRENTDKYDFENANVGWKFHLNVDPKHVQQVAEYLTQNNFFHKFLEGGEPDNGKIFTVYIGSKKLADKLAQDISQNIGEYLSYPKSIEEVEFSRGIVGRFVALREATDGGVTDDKYSPYGTYGISLLKKQDSEKIKTQSALREQGISEEQIKTLTLQQMRTMAEIGVKHLKQDFGEYFSG